MIEQGKKAPNFKGVNQEGHKVSLSDFKGRWLVLYFYPKDNTPGCSIEAQAFSSKKDEFSAFGCEILGVSADSLASHCKFIEKKKLTIDLLSDEDKVICELYGVWQKKKFLGKEYMGIVRSTFLIDPKGKVAAIWSPVKLMGHVDDVLGKVKELA